VKFPRTLDDCPILTEELLGRLLVMLIARLVLAGPAPGHPLKPPVHRDRLDKFIEAAERGEVVELVTRIEVSGETLRRLRDDLWPRGNARPGEAMALRVARPRWRAATSASGTTRSPAPLARLPLAAAA